MINSISREFRTSPVECWKKCKELRIQYFKEFATARNMGKLVVTGSGGGAQALVSGIPGAIFFPGEPYGAQISTDPAFAKKCCEAAHTQGFARDLDSYMRNYLGSMYLDCYFFGGPFPRPDLVLTFHRCDTHFKWFQLVAEYFGAPMFGIDEPVGCVLSESIIHHTDYMASQILDSIDWLVKITGKPFDDEAFINTLNCMAETKLLWAQICLLNQAIPAPLDLRQLSALYFPNFMLFHKEKTPVFYRELLDEVKYRVQEGIAARPYERMRLLHDNQPPWHWLSVFDLIAQYGAVAVGSQYILCGYSFFETDDAGLLTAPRTTWEQARKVCNREEAALFMAKWQISRLNQTSFCATAKERADQLLLLIQQWHCGAALFHLNRGCEGLAQYQLENKLTLQEAGIPIGTYEGNMADPTEFDSVQVTDHIESFMESLGLTKISPLSQG